jgi:hypothetical protein
MCQPDVILCTYTEDIVNDMEAKTGIPVVAVGMGTLFEDDYDDALRILGEACGVSERAEEVIAYIDACLEDLKVRTCDIPDEEKPTVLSAAATFKGAHGIEGVRLVDSVLTAINANNIAAASAEGTTAQTAEVDREQILAWNPDYIFCDCSGVPLVKQDMAEDPNFYAQLTAYNEGRIYQHPSTTSYYSNLEIPLVNCYFIGSVLYPEAFADVDANLFYNDAIVKGKALGVLKGVGLGDHKRIGVVTDDLHLFGGVLDINFQLSLNIAGSIAAGGSVVHITGSTGNSLRNDRNLSAAGVVADGHGKHLSCRGTALILTSAEKETCRCCGNKDFFAVHYLLPFLADFFSAFFSAFFTSSFFSKKLLTG